MSGDSSAIPRFEIFRSLFIELITRNQRLNEKVNQLEKQHHNHIDELKVIGNYLNVFIDQHNDQLNSGQIQMKELKTENEQLQKKFGEYVTQFDKTQIENKHSQEQTNQLRQQCQEENQTHIKELENLNNRLSTLSVTLNDSLQDNKIQMNKIIDEHQQLKEESNNLREQHQIEIKELLNSIHRITLHENDHTDRLKLQQIQMKELQNENQQLKKQLDEQMIRSDELKNDNKSLREQNKQLEQMCQQTNQTHITAFENNNDRLNADIGQLRDQLDNTLIQMKEVRQVAQDLRQEQHIRIKELADTSNDFRTCIKEHDDRFNNDQLLMKELKIENEQFKKRADELLNDNGSFQERIRRLEGQCQQASQTQIKVVENINDRLDAEIGQLRDQLDNTLIQIRAVHQVDQEVRQQQHVRIGKLADITDDFLTCIREHDDRLNNDQQLMKELKSENEQFKKRADELLDGHGSFEERIRQLEEQCQQASQTQIKVVENINDRLDADIGQLRDQLHDTLIQTKEVHQVNQDLRQEQHIRIKELADRLNNDQLLITELKTENEQFKKRADEPLNDNGSFQERIRQLEEQCQQANQTQIKVVENINDRLNADMGLLRDQLDNTVIQVKEVDQVVQELCQQQDIRIKELADSTNNFRTCIKEHDDRLNNDQLLMRELKTENEQFKKRVEELLNENGSFEERIRELEEQCQQASQTQIKVIGNSNDCLNADIGQLRDQLDNTVIQIKRVEDENTQLIEQSSRFNEQNEQQEQSASTKVTDISSHLHSGLTHLDNQSEKNKKLEMTSRDINENHIVHNISIMKPKADDQRQPKTNVQIDELDDPLKTDTSDGVNSVIFRTEPEIFTREPGLVKRLSKLYDPNQTGLSRKGSKLTTA